MKSLALLIAPLLLFSCINENTLHSNFPIHNFHGNSAKVWVLSKTSNLNDKNLPAMPAYRKCFIFYSNKTFREQELIHLGSNEGLVGKYSIEEEYSGDNVLTLYYSDNDHAYFKIEDIGNNFLSLTNFEEDQATWEFKSLKPPSL